MTSVNRSHYNLQKLKLMKKENLIKILKISGEVMVCFIFLYAIYLLAKKNS